MTYKYKLARRLALSRELSMVPVLLLLAACTDETTGPNTSLPQLSAPRVIPASVTIETNQRVPFRSQTVHGKTVATALTWQSFGGTITSEGVFYASAPGTYKVVGHGRGHQSADTSTVTVVPPPADVTAVQVTPGDATLDVGTSRTFTATALLSDGISSAVGVTWTATGGSIDAGGVFNAGMTAGKFKMIATRATGDVADTATVSVTAPAPTLRDVIVKPASYSINAGDTKQFSAYRHNSLGDSVAIQVVFSATGGAINSSGLYTAGSTSGTYRVVASASGLADTAVVTLAAPAPAPLPAGGAGLPFGFYRLLLKASDPGPFTLSAESNSASTIVSQIEHARSLGVKVMLMLTGDGHATYMSTIDGVYQFDRSKWDAKLATYNTATIRQAIAAGVADGTIIGASVMDEPYVSGGATGGGNTWGPKGTMTKARVDSLCADVQRMFPTLPAGVDAQHQLFEPDKSYRVCQFITDQYSTSYGDVATWRDAGLAMTRRDGHAILFSLNVLDGGVPDRDGTWDCTGAGQGGKGTYSPMCRMTATQLEQYGAALGPYGCGLFMWRYDGAYATNGDNVAVLKDLATRLASAPSRACRRS
jgi:hypothetical protein